MTHNALVASHHYIVTAIPDHLSTIGLNILMRKADEIGDLVLQAVRLAGKSEESYRPAQFAAILFVRVRIGGQMTTNAHEGIMETVRAQFTCFDTHTTELIGYTEAAENSIPVWFHRSDNARRATQKQEYPKIVDELLEII